MKKTITKIIEKKDFRTLLSNFSYLSIIEVSNYILPFIAIPYIVRVIGVEKYGVIMFAYAVMAFFEIIINWGFKYIATKHISIHRDDNYELSKYFWGVICTQLFLSVISFTLFALLLTFIDRFNQETTVFLLSFAMVIGKVFFPIWFFQGIEKMKYIAIFTMISRIIYTLMIFLFVESSSDYTLIPLFNASSYLILAVFSIFFIHRRFGVKVIQPSLKNIKTHLIDGWHIFLSSISNTLYTSINTVLLGLLTNYSAVGLLSLATTISSAITKIARVFSRVTFPHIAKFSDDKKRLTSKARTLFKAYFSALVFVGFVTALSASTVIPLVYGPGKEEAIFLLQILAISLMLEPLGSFFTSYLVIKSQSNIVAKVAFYTMIVNLIFIVPAIYFFNVIGVVVVKFIVVSFHTLINLRYNKELISKSYSAKEDK